MEYIETNGITLHARVEGDPKNPLIVLLHGFPEFMKAWEKVVDGLVKSNYYVVLPDLRGYNLSSKPKGKKYYQMNQLVDDIRGIIIWTGKKQAIVAGHDWGGFIAWNFAMDYPEILDKLIIVNAPHPNVMAKFLKDNPDQQKKSRYIKFFKIPIIPEIILKRKDYTNLVRSLKGSSLKGTFSKEDIEEYKDAWKKSSISGMLNYYRANSIARTRDKFITTDTLIIWGKNDRFLSYEMADRSSKECRNAKVEYIDDATHWVLHERPDDVILLILNFLQ